MAPHSSVGAILVVGRLKVVDRLGLGRLANYNYNYYNN